MKDYRVMPDEGLFEKIEHRVRLRRMTKVGCVALAAALVVGVAVWLLKPSVVNSETVASTEVAEASAEYGVRSAELAAASPELCGVPSARPTTPNIKLRTEIAQQSVTKEESPVVEVSSVVPMSTVAIEPVDPAKTVITPMVQETKTEEIPVVYAEIDVPPTIVEVEPAAKDGGSTSATPHYENLLWAPNVIVPSSDDADNRVFKVQTTSAVSHFHLIIFNRGGRQIFSTDDIDRGWDATVGGSTVPQGTYVWVARYRDSAGNLREEKGTVTVVR